MRRGPGIAGLQRRQEEKAAVAAASERLGATEFAEASARLEALRANLTEFARKHRSRINSDPQFRQAFLDMSISAGVDVLGSSRSFWDELLGVGHFYNELAVQVLTVCLQTRDANGGILDLDDCLAMLRRSRRGDVVVADDICRAIQGLSALGSGVAIRQCAGRKLLCSNPQELSADPSQVLEIAAAAGGKVSAGDLVRKLSWTRQRADAALAHFVREGLCWVDTQQDDLPPFEWRRVRRGDSLPSTSFCAGQTKSDGDVFVARTLLGEAGRLTLRDGKVRSIWAHHEGEVTEGDVLVASESLEWCRVQKGQSLPSGAIWAGKTRTDEDVYVARGTGGECGKLNLLNGKVNAIWYHGCWAAQSAGEVLVSSSANSQELPFVCWFPSLALAAATSII